MTAKIKKHEKTKRHKHMPRGVKNQDFEKIYWPYLPIILIISVLLTFSLQSGVFNMSAMSGKVLAYANGVSQEDMLEETNDARIEDGAEALSISPSLSSAAKSKAADMSERNYWSHNTPEGTPPWSFVSNAGYQYQKLGENLAAGFSNEKQVINAWLASPEHKNNMLDPSFKEVGFGFANNPNYKAGEGPMTIFVAYYGLGSGQDILPASIGSTNQTGIDLSDHGFAKTTSPNRAAVALAKLPFGSMGSILIFVVLIGSLLIWVGRHARGIHKSLVRGERYVFSHPFLDVSLVILAALCFMLTKTAGFIS